MESDDNKGIILESGDLRLWSTGDQGFRMENRTLWLEFAFPDGRLEVTALGGCGSRKESAFAGEPVDVQGAVMWAEGKPEFRVESHPGKCDRVEAVWDGSGSGFFKWILVVHHDPACVELHMEASPGWIKSVLEQSKGTGAVSQAESFATVESINPKARSFRGDDLLATIGIGQKHIRLNGVHLHDITDYFDCLVLEKTLHSGYLGVHAFAGNILECDNLATGNGLLLARLAPTPEAHYLKRHTTDFQWINRGGVAVYGTGMFCDALPENGVVQSYGLVLMTGKTKTLRQTWRAHYRQQMQADVFSQPVSLSNTWGDRNQDAALNEKFADKELRALADVGLRGLMLDDGWQAGITANSKLETGGIWEGYHSSDKPFWEVHPGKFPNGLGPLVETAASLGREIALWFSPDSSSDFINWEKDAAVLLALYSEYEIRCFKLDGIKLRSRLGEQRFGAFLQALQDGSDGRIISILDVTSEIRQGYLREVQHGILFLENRYTDWGNYFPHRTLRNIWQLAHWIPTQRLHIEFLNPLRNRDRYAGDPFGPEQYPMSYLYALTLVGHPLAWMEMQHLHPDDRDVLREVVCWHNTQHQWLLSADIEPVGQLPDGRSFSGFAFHFPDGREALLLFREFSETDHINLPLREGHQLEWRIGSSPATIERIDSDLVRVTLPQPGNWAFLGTD